MVLSVLRPGRYATALLTLCGCLFSQASLADDNDVVEIEEHWELEVGGPDAGRSAPQVTMIMSPVDNLNGDFFALTINHWSYPDFEEGGYQLQRWHGEECQEAAHGARTNPIEQDGEVISWVQRISVNEGILKFHVLNGQSESWSQFGGEGFLISTPTSLSRLNNYRPGVSIEQSGIGYAGNRVSSLVLQKIRWKTADGEEHEMVAPIDIDSDLDP
jgi:hypothetical protein